MDQLPPKPPREPRKPKKKEEPETVLPLPKFKYDWYQTEKYVTVTVFAKGVQKEDLEVAIQDKKLTLSLYKGKEDEFVFDTNLAYAINTQKSHWKILSTKVCVCVCVCHTVYLVCVLLSRWRLNF
jgi:HSP20 family molecular chaperone IbpA